jgi:glycosyltransferase involved in cell wall biosynthesis
MGSTPLVSVCVITYQHERFIARCLDGVLMQKTDFPFEIIIGENESSDRTHEICTEYAKKYPGKIRLQQRPRSEVIIINGQPTGRLNLIKSIEESRGKYIALCEGDDYWTDEQKLAKQVAFLESSGRTACFHESRLVDENDSILASSYLPLKRDLSQEDAFRYGNHFSIASLMFRKDGFHYDELWKKLSGGDRYMTVKLSEQGLIGYIPDEMCAYRKHSGGLWSGTKEAEKCQRLYNDYILYYEVPEYRRRYGKILRRKMCDNLSVISQQLRKSDSFTIRMKRGLLYFRLMPWEKYYLKLFISAILFPALYTIIKGRRPING